MTALESPPRDRQRRRKVLRTVAFFVVVVAVGVMVVVFSGRFGEDVSAADSPLIGRPAPSLGLAYLDGSGTLHTDDLRGEIVVVNFWASWCAPCRVEYPVLLAAARRHEGHGVRFVGILHDDDPQHGNEFLDEFGRAGNYEYVSGDGTDASIEYGIYGIPETFVVDADGIIAAKITGVVTPESLDAAIEKAVGSGSPTG